MKFSKSSGLMLAAAAAMAMASMPFAGAQASLQTRPGYTTPHRDKPRQHRQHHRDRLARLHAAEAKRERRRARDQRLAARGAFGLTEAQLVARASRQAAQSGLPRHA